MKNVKAILIVLSMLFVSLNCNEKGTEPPEEKPPGQQENIIWPSLKQTDWPMAFHDPQNTGRSQFAGPVNNSVSIMFDQGNNREFNGGIVIDSDGGILFTSNSDSGNVIIRLSKDGKTIFERSLESQFENVGTPILAADKIITHNGFNKIFCFDSTGNKIWTYESDGKIFNKTVSVDKNGNIYFTNILHKMQVLNPEGELIWEIMDSRINSMAVVYNLSFSPDGKTVYIPGQGVSVIAVDIDNRNIKWTYGNGNTGISIVVDVEGNLYFVEEMDSGAKIISLQPNGEKRWEYLFHGSGSKEMCIDYNGNIYFGSDSLYSVNYKGNLRWKMNLKGFLSCNLVCDLDNNVYAVILGSRFQKISDDGIPLWERVLNVSIIWSQAIGNQTVYLPAREGIIYKIK